MDEHGEEFYHFALRKSREHQQWFAERPLDETRRAEFERVARESIERQREIEASDEVSFEEFLHDYFAQT